MDKMKCTICGYIYDPADGDPERNVNPETRFEDVPDDWRCPLCGAMKKWFERVKT